MSIVKLKVHNFLGLSDFEANLTEGLNVVRGSNGSGKSSVLKAVEKGLRGGRMDARWAIHRMRDDSLAGVPVEGVDHDSPAVAEILLELKGGIQVRRKISEKGVDVTVTREGEPPMKAPQTFLDSIVSPTSLNPVEFLQAPAADRRRILLSLVPPLLTRDDMSALLQRYELAPEDIHAVLGPVQKIGLDELRRLDEAILVRRQAAWAKKEHHEEAAKAEAKKLPTNYDHTKLPPDFQEIMKRLDTAGRTQSAVASAKHSLSSIVTERDRANQAALKTVTDADEAFQRAKGEVTRIEEEIARLQARLQEAKGEVQATFARGHHAIADAKDECQKLELRVTDAQEKLNAATAAAVDPEPIKVELAGYEQEKAWRVAFDQAQVHAADRERHAKDVRNFDLANQEGIRVAAPKLLWSRLDETPLKGLELGMEGDRITVRGVDMDNLSTFEQMDLSIRIAELTAPPANLPDGVRTILADGFEAMDPAMQKAFIERTKAGKFQYIVAVVDEGALRVNGEPYREPPVELTPKEIKEIMREGGMPA